MRESEPPRPHNREGIWYHVRRVPKRFRGVVPHILIRTSTGIRVADDPRAIRARAAVATMDKDLFAGWEAEASGDGSAARLHYEQARRRASELGLVYRTSQELADGPLDEILKRVQLLVSRDAVEDEREVAATLGGVEHPGYKLSELLDEYARISRSELAQMSVEQRRKWRNPRARALKNFIDVVGDRSITTLTRADAHLYRDWWERHIDENLLDIRTANRDIGTLSRMLRRVEVHHGVSVRPIFSGLLLQGGREKQREAFSPSWIQERLLARGALDALNEDARDLVYILTETGLRPSEASSLTAETIALDHPVPHVQVRPVGRILKTPDSERDIPLVGIALEAMRRHPEGFPRYRDRDALSALVNQYLRRHGLLETSKHSLYGLRHTFEDRLTAVEAPEKVVATLMGHKWHRPRYGKGPSLEQKKRWMEQIAFPVTTKGG